MSQECGQKTPDEPAQKRVVAHFSSLADGQESVHVVRLKAEFSPKLTKSASETNLENRS